LWAERPALTKGSVGGAEEIQVGFGGDDRDEQIARRFQKHGYRFVPLVTRALDVSCHNGLLYLRPGAAGGIIRRQDIDNRIKTLFDGLKMPGDAQDLGAYTSPAAGRTTPSSAFVEDDSLITSLSVKPTCFWKTTGSEPAADEARLLIHVIIRPIRFRWNNAVFVGA
jgi:hypothetical protein